MIFWCTYCKRTIASDEIRGIRVDTHLSTCKYFNPNVKGDPLSPINEEIMSPICDRCGVRHDSLLTCMPEDRQNFVIRQKHEAIIEQLAGSHSTTEASRVEINSRYDLILPEFIRMMAMIMDLGAKKYGELNYQINELRGSKGAVNHMMEHLMSYKLDEGYDHFDGHNNWNLAAVAVNAMMEWFWANKKAQEGKS